MRKHKKIKQFLILILLAVVMITGVANQQQAFTTQPVIASAKSKTLSVKKIKKKLKNTAPKSVSVKNNADKPYQVLNNNKPYFKRSWLTTKSFEYYSPLDKLGRCGTAFACVGKDIMPTEERGSIGAVRPSGWQTVKYDRSIISDLYLYNRCHLLGYQLTGENANTKNLITGTRYLNVFGMLPFEDEVTNAVKYKDVHVLYRVTPVFTGNNLVADGVVMEAMSCEDAGKTLTFCVFCPNIQPGIIIDYSNGDSKLDDSYTNKSDANNSSSNTNTGDANRYILNTNTRKFHYPNCASVNDMADHNKKESISTREEIIASGYSPCGRCNP